MAEAGLGVTGADNTALSVADLLNQTISIMKVDGTLMPVTLASVDATQQYIIGTTIGYSIEFGASLVMLAVKLAMTPKSKFRRTASYINTAALCNNLVRTILLAIYFQSSWARFYVFYTGDSSSVTEADFRNSVCSVMFSIPQNLLMMAALMIQAWAMVKLWPDTYKWFILVISGVLSLAEVGLMLTAQVNQIISFYPNYDSYGFLTQHLWVRYWWLILELTSICWFCFMFNLRLVTHMWNHRSFLPSTSGLSAMDVLVMTNGVLMLIPVIFVSLQIENRYNFETGSMVYTSVIVVMSLGALVAQRLADPGAFSSDRSRGNTRIGGNAPDGRSAYMTGKKPLLPTWSQSDNNSTVYSGHRGSRGGRVMTGVTSTISSERHSKQSSDPIKSFDLELARIDDDVEMGRVRVDREIQQSEEVL